MNQIELRDKVQELYNDTSIKVSDYVIKGIHYLSCFYAANGNTYHIHSSVNDGLIEEKHREKLYKELLVLKEKK
jgi:hypothetical protein